MTNTLTAGEKRLIKALAATGQPKVMIHVNARRTWSLAFGAPGWKAQTFLSLADRGYLHIEYGFSGRKDVSLTDLGRAALDAPESSLPPMKLSDVQSKVLARVAAGEVTWRHAGWRDKPFGGINVTSTVKSLARRGLIDDGTDVAVLKEPPDDQPRKRAEGEPSTQLERAHSLHDRQHRRRLRQQHGVQPRIRPRRPRHQLQQLPPLPQGLPRRKGRTMTEYLPEPVPRCDKHGPMTLRPLAEQSKETAWCGAWYDCRFVEHGHTCGRTTLIQSKELRAQLEEQRAARAAREAAGTNMRADRRVSREA